MDYHVTFCTTFKTQILCCKPDCLPAQHLCYTRLTQNAITLPVCAGTLESGATPSFTCAIASTLLEICAFAPSGSLVRVSCCEHGWFFSSTEMRMRLTLVWQ